MKTNENPNPTENELYAKNGKCYFCKKAYHDFGHNPEPLAKFHNRVCDSCNATKVIPARLKK